MATSTTRTSRLSVLQRSLITRGIPIVTLILGAAACSDDADTNTDDTDTGNGGTEQDTGGGTEQDTADDTGNGDDVEEDTVEDDTDEDTDTVEGDTEGDTDTDTEDVEEEIDPYSPEGITLTIQRFCSALSDCSPAIVDCVGDQRTFLEDGLAKSEECYRAYADRLRLMSEGECIEYEYNGEVISGELLNALVDAEAEAIICSGANPDQVALAIAYCELFADCEDGFSLDNCKVDNFFSLVEYGEMRSDFLECVLAHAECVEETLEQEGADPIVTRHVNVDVCFTTD